MCNNGHNLGNGSLGTVFGILEVSGINDQYYKMNGKILNVSKLFLTKTKKIYIDEKSSSYLVFHFFLCFDVKQRAKNLALTLRRVRCIF